MLTEEVRIFAGLQESSTKSNPLPGYITEVQEAQKVKELRSVNTTYNVASNFDLFKSKMDKFKALFTLIEAVVETDNAKTFINGIMEKQYSKLEQFVDIVLNESMAQSMLFLENNFNAIEKEVLSIQYINEEIDEDSADTYFVSNLITSKGHHGIRFHLYENKDLTNQIGSELPYGTQIVSISENSSMVKLDGKRVYSSLTRADLKELEDKGLLL